MHTYANKGHQKTYTKYYANALSKMKISKTEYEDAQTKDRDHMDQIALVRTISSANDM